MLNVIPCMIGLVRGIQSFTVILVVADFLFFAGNNTAFIGLCRFYLPSDQKKRHG